ncbi:MAG TPA: ABC transporter substrate-binding protein [Aliidongia sp.]|uniref:ABC transporter substrate-binding protein n=1 Tax=Aliidongia sp. TaxID=1914230 RepID=UPI002DDD1D23|nr:ABC transporter substrate-binding protein [Aliidongia sp.]HEV2674216.1 ABC transporter substrate-binding protein [Aliidongia sp.]
MAYPKLRAASAALALLLADGQAFATSAPQPAPVAAAPEPGPHGPASAVVDAFDGTLLGVMKQADKLGYEGRAKDLEPAIESAFNIPLMTRIIVGSPWTEWNEEQRGHIVDAFGKFIVATYARRFDGYGGEDFVDDGEKPAVSGGTLVTTRLTRPKDPAVTLTYLMRDGDNGPQIVDVFLTGTISELATRRSEFSAVLQQGGYQALLTALEKKTAAQAAGGEAE